MRKSQVISMDFIMSFVVFIFAVSVFLFALKSDISVRQNSLDAPAELIFSRLDQIYDENYDFLDGSRINSAKLEALKASYDKNRLYDFLFQDFEDFLQFKKMEYCIFIMDYTQTGGIRVSSHFAAYSSQKPNYEISFVNIDSVICGQAPQIQTVLPKCTNKKAEAITLTKPVLYGNDIVDLKVLICAERR